MRGLWGRKDPLVQRFRAEVRRIMREGKIPVVYGAVEGKPIPYLVMKGSECGTCPRCWTPLHIASDTRNEIVIVDADGWPHAEAMA